jgi:hypothetical protein
VNIVVASLPCGSLLADCCCATIHVHENVKIARSFRAQPSVPQTESAKRRSADAPTCVRENLKSVHLAKSFVRSNIQKGRDRTATRNR